MQLLLRAPYGEPCGSLRIEVGCIAVGRRIRYLMLPVVTTTAVAMRLICIGAFALSGAHTTFAVQPTEYVVTPTTAHMILQAASNQPIPQPNRPRRVLVYTGCPTPLSQRLPTLAHMARLRYRPVGKLGSHTTNAAFMGLNTHTLWEQGRSDKRERIRLSAETPRINTLTFLTLGDRLIRPPRAATCPDDLALVQRHKRASRTATDREPPWAPTRLE